MHTLYTCDEQCMRDAQKLIVDEFSYVLKTDKLIITEQIDNALEK